MDPQLKVESVESVESVENVENVVECNRSHYNEE